MLGKVYVAPGVGSWHRAHSRYIELTLLEDGRCLGSLPHDLSPVYLSESMDCGKGSILISVGEGAVTFSKVELHYYQNLIFPSGH